MPDKPQPIRCAPDCGWHEYTPVATDPEDSCEGSGDGDDY